MVVGSSGHAKVVIDALELQGGFRILGLIDRFREKGETTAGHPVLGGEKEMAALGEIGGVVAIGDNWVRAEVVQTILKQSPGFQFISAIHPSAQIGQGVSIGVGTVVMAGVVINRDSRIGAHCIINTHASVDHDNVIGDFVSIAPNAATGGNVRIDNHSVLSIGSNVVHRVSIGEHTVIGAGATVLEDVPGFVVAVGTPARVLRSRVAGEKYL